MAVMIDSNWHCRGVLEITRRNRQVALVRMDQKWRERERGRNQTSTLGYSACVIRRVLK